MRVLQIINSLDTGGAEKLILDTVPIYRKKKIEMDVLLLWDNDHMFKKELEEIKCCTIFTLKKSSNYKDIYNPFNILKIAKIIKHYSVVHVHLFPAQYYVVFANLLNGNKSKLIFTEHSTSNTRMNSFFLKGIDRLTYKGYKKVVAISNDVELIFNKYLNNAKKRIVTIENGVNLSKIHNSVALKKTQLVYSLTEENKLIVQVGGFRIEKDQDTIIKALQFLPNTFHLLFVGQGERKADLEALVNKMGVQDRVHFLGVRKDVFAILKCVDYVVVSSHWEGFGLAAVEGMAASKPVVASNVNGLKEVVGGAGVLFEKENSKQFADIIIKLDTDLAYYNSIAEACKQKAEQFDIAIMVEKHINLYKTVYES